TVPLCLHQEALSGPSSSRAKHTCPVRETTLTYSLGLGWRLSPVGQLASRTRTCTSPPRPWQQQYPRTSWTLRAYTRPCETSARFHSRWLSQSQPTSTPQDRPACCRSLQISRPTFALLCILRDTDSFVLGGRYSSYATGRPEILQGKRLACLIPALYGCDSVQVLQPYPVVV
ncbi:unnamed protein product, partial [Ectocarpus sp. 12 AP-2014]